MWGYIVAIIIILLIVLGYYFRGYIELAYWYADAYLDPPVVPQSVAVATPAS